MPRLSFRSTQERSRLAVAQLGLIINRLTVNANLDRQDLHYIAKEITAIAEDLEAPLRL